MSNNNENNTSIIPISSTGIVRAGNSIAVTNKLLTESKFQFRGDFKGEQLWKTEAHNMAVRKIILAENVDGEACIISCSEDGEIGYWNVNDGKLSKNKKKQSNNKEDEIHIIPDLISLDVSNENELKFPENFMRLYSPDNKF